MNYIGIDPGKHGALSVVGDIEPYSVCFGKLTNADIVNEIGIIITSNRNRGESVAILENVHATPIWGRASLFTFGTNFGLIQGALYAFKIPFELVTPSEWQRDMRCLSKGDKNVTKIRAQQLFPQIKCTHENSDSLLIAEWCKRKHTRISIMERID